MGGAIRMEGVASCGLRATEVSVKAREEAGMR